MNDHKNIEFFRSRFKPYIWVLAIVWTIIVITSLAWNLANEKEHMLDEAYIHAKVTYVNDLQYRRWAAGHGGVYAPVTEKTPPNPYLSHIPERDIVTPSGKLLTLINPAYMTRQVHELIEGVIGLKGHITSLNPIRPENAPDPWERDALHAFERSEREVSSVEMMEGKEYLRVMFPLVTEEPCLKCHAAQGYKIGDIRGGISISFPMEAMRPLLLKHRLLMSASHLVMLVLVLAGIFGGGRKLIQSDRMRLQAAEKMEDRNSELSVLFKISAAISRTIDINELLSSILSTITEIDILNIENKGGIFILEGKSMKLVSHLGHPDVFLDLHKEMKVGDCLCGKAAETGEIIISRNCENDTRHTIKYPGMTPHGHIIIPLNVRDKVIGVLYLYHTIDFDINEDKLKLFTSIGNQIGVAIDNARLHEETRMSSLHDPITGLANRRSMDIEMKKSIANAVRFKRPLSVIMLDIDHFKEYNDTHGHSEGDRVLVEVAKVVLKETREIDTAIRYGGEEFLVLLPETELKSASDVAERIRQAVETSTKVTISLGVTSYSEGMHRDEIVIKADQALYKAKQNGRNRVEVNE